MKLTVQTGFIFFLLLFLSVMAACSVLETDEMELTPVYDCPNLERNTGDSCQFAPGQPGYLSDTCTCLPFDSVAYNCLQRGVTLGDSCLLPDGTTGMIQAADCDCLPIPDSLNYDCPRFSANVGDVCRDSVLGGDTLILRRVNENCWCNIEDVTYHGGPYCENLRTTKGYPCVAAVAGQDTTYGFATQDCRCDSTITQPVYDCYFLKSNVGDSCRYVTTAGDTLKGIFGDDCGCEIIQ